MKQVAFISDLHLGLTTDELDRTDEIINITLDFARYIITNEIEFVVFGGDIFHNNNPSEYLIGQFIRVINLLQKHNKKTFILVGNHDSISSDSRKSCLDFINKLKFYPDIKLISDIKCIEVFQSDIGKIFFSFFPHITKFHLKDTKFNDTQSYIDKKTFSIYKKVGAGNHNIMFSHLNVKGVIPSVEKDFLKKSSVFLSKSCFENKMDGSILPLILQGHIHSKSIIDNLNIVGSPVFVSFGEKDKNKYFAVLDIPESLDENFKVNFIKTDAIKFKEIDFDFTNYRDGMLDIFTSKKFIKSITNKILKLNITIDEKFAHVNWDEVLKNVIDSCYHLKPVRPKVIRKKIKRDENQKIDLSPIDSLKVWFKKNKPVDYKDKYQLAKKIIMECNENT